jgi:hypothetical protein
MPAPMLAPLEQPKKSKKGLFITLGIIGAVILIAIASVVGYNLYMSDQYAKAQTLFSSGSYQEARDAFDKLGGFRDSKAMSELSVKWIDYEAAIALFDQEDYEAALQAFESLGSFEDAPNRARLCTDNINYLQARKDLEAGELDKALSAFEALADAGFKDSAEQVQKTKYAMADKLAKDGDLYGAYKAFKALGSYEDSATRMAQCMTAFPADGTLSFNDAFASSTAELVIDGAGASYASYFKLYSGDTLVASFWVNAGGKVTLRIAPGDYGLKQSTGPVWFGEEIMFGEEGSYLIMTFENDSKTFNLGYNVRLTISLSTTGDAGTDIGAERTGREGF